MKAYTVLDNIDKIDRKEWESFVLDHPNGSIFQTPLMFDLYLKIPNYTPVFIVLKRNDEIEALMISLIIREYKNILGNFTARSVIRGGPLLKNNDTELLEAMLKEYVVRVERYAVYSQFRNLWNWDQGMKEIFIKHGFGYEDHLNITVNLNKSTEVLWKEIHPKRRNEIRKAEKNEIQVKSIHDYENFTNSYKILKDVYNRAGLPLHSFDFFKSAYELFLPKDRFIIFGAFLNNYLIGTMYVLCYKNTMYDWYAGSSAGFYNKCPNDILPWKAFIYGNKNNYHVFDFGGAGKPGIPYGVRDYKIKFGGELVNYGRFIKVHKKSLYSFSAGALRIWKKIKRK
ncbi:MAG: peptidoglycan bridge formation glycyltransferase FemA/FemB family protein [Bacteroidota bacterium]